MSRFPSASDIQFHFPRLRLPLFFIVDDPAPCLNLAFYEQYFESHVRDIPTSFTAAWADLIEEFGVRGKFSVLPIPAGIGRIDRPLPDVDPTAQAEFLDIVRERVSPQMDICIEFLTHFLAWDITRERPMDYTEKTMSPFTNRDHLTRYFAYGLQILHDLGLNPTGATSPGAACREIEWDYQAALRDAVRSITGNPLAWYFLHVDTHSPTIPPRIMSLDSASGEGCVTVLSGTGDPSWNTQFGQPSNLDILISADGQSGRLVELVCNRSVLGFHTHWQSLFSNGRGTGLTDLRTTLSRIREHFGDRVLWMKCSELARYVAAQAVTRGTVAPQESGLKIQLTSSLSCPDFTFSLPCEREIRAVTAPSDPHNADLEADRAMSRVLESQPFLTANSWQQKGGVLTCCADLPKGTLLLHAEFHE